MEICPHHLLLDLDDLVRLGPYGVCAPALRDSEPFSHELTDDELNALLGDDPADIVVCGASHVPLTGKWATPAS